MIRKASAQDLMDVVSIHLESFPGSFSTSLGKRFLNYFYSKQVESPDFIFLVNVDETGRVLGYITGSPCSNAAYGSLVKRNLIGLALRVPLGLVLSTASLQKGVKLVRGYLEHYAARKKGPKILMADQHVTRGMDIKDTYAGKWGHLIAIAVSSQARGRGVGKALISALHEKMILHNVDYVLLGTYEDNVEGNALFQRCGYRLIGERKTDSGKVMHQYRWDPR